MASRLIVKNLPKHATEERMRDYFAAMGEVTDCRLKKTKEGVSRNFGFIGFRSPEQAQQAITKLNRSFFDTSRITVEIAQTHGSDGIARPWSRFSPGSTKHAKEQEIASGGVAQTEVKLGGGLTGKQLKDDIPKEEMRSSEGASASAAMDVEVAAPKQATADDGDGVDDLSWLKKKSADAPAPADDAAAGEDPKKGKKKKKAKAKAKAGSEAAADDDQAAAGKDQAAAGEADGPSKTSEGTAPENDGDDDGDSNGRLYVTNLPYGTLEEELRKHFESVGEVQAVAVCKDEDTLKSRGFGYVTYVFPENAVRAQADLDMQPFQGRMLKVVPAREKPEPKDRDIATTTLSRTSSYKRNLELRKKRVDAHMQHTWNLLYVSSNAAADVAAAQMGIAKGDLFGKDAENAALTAALTETSIIQQTKRWLQKEGIRVDAFEQSGPSLDKTKAVDVGEGKRREDTFIVKHLPAGASPQELRERFTRYGEMVRCSLSPSGTVAIVQYTDKSCAQRAFSKVAFSRYRHVPLYLEWAPPDMFTDEGARPQESEGGAVSSTASAEPKGSAENKDDLPDNEDGDESRRGSLFVKNLSFATTDAALKSAFSGCRGFRVASIMKKKAAQGTEAKGGKEESKSMGYGFVEFDSPASAMEALKRRQGLVVDGKALQLQVSQRGSRHDQSGDKAGKKGKGPLKTQRLCVRNLAFEATRKELHQLFSHYGSVTAVRIPKKSDYTGHRGFAFIDFASKAEAAAAYEALQHTHLYGRRMVIEPAEEAATDVGTVQETAQKRRAAKEGRSEAKKRRKAGVLNAPGDAGSFEEAMMK
mmetsp:Transcript_125407/g.401604  ORF Transcript_125407/g.401604 Transcript_125407/m.401604 type:complete len:815 (+) Transcript_125407:69-2513(+)